MEIPVPIYFLYTLLSQKYNNHIQYLCTFPCSGNREKVTVRCAELNDLLDFFEGKEISITGMPNNYIITLEKYTYVFEKFEITTNATNKEIHSD